MRPLAFLLSAVALATASSGVAAQTVTHTYTGKIEIVDNLPNPQIKVGDQITVTYVLDTSAPTDEDPDPGWGYYQSLRSLRIQIPSVGVDVTGAPDIVQTRNNWASDDGRLHDWVYFLSRTLSQPDDIQGTPIRRVAADFNRFSDSVDQPADLVTSDALPFYRLKDTWITASLNVADFNDVRLYFHAEEVTSPDPDPEPTVAELVSSAVERLQLSAASGSINHGIARALSVKLQHAGRAHASGKPVQACSLLRAFSQQVSALKGKQMPAALSAELRAYSGLLDTAMGGCR